MRKIPIVHNGKEVGKFVIDEKALPSNIFVEQVKFCPKCLRKVQWHRIIIDHISKRVSLEFNYESNSIIKAVVNIEILPQIFPERIVEEFKEDLYIFRGNASYSNIQIGSTLYFDFDYDSSPIVLTLDEPKLDDNEYFRYALHVKIIMDEQSFDKFICTARKVWEDVVCTEWWPMHHFSSSVLRIFDKYNVRLGFIKDLSHSIITQKIDYNSPWYGYDKYSIFEELRVLLDYPNLFNQFKCALGADPLKLFTKFIKKPSIKTALSDPEVAETVTKLLVRLR